MLVKEELNELETRIADLELAVKVLETNRADSNDCSFDEAYTVLNTQKQDLQNRFNMIINLKTGSSKKNSTFKITLGVPDMSNTSYDTVTFKRTFNAKQVVQIIKEYFTPEGCDILLEKGLNAWGWITITCEQTGETVFQSKTTFWKSVKEYNTTVNLVGEVNDNMQVTEILNKHLAGSKKELENKLNSKNNLLENIKIYEEKIQKANKELAKLDADISGLNDTIDNINKELKEKESK